MENVKTKTTAKKNKITSIIDFLSSITKRKKNTSPNLSIADKKRIKKLMVESIEESGGEVAARERAANIGQTYFELDKDGRKEILLLLLSFKHDEEKIKKEISKIVEDLDENKKFKEINIYDLKKALISPRKKILKNFNFLENGISLLVEMREDLLGFIDAGNSDLIPLEKDFEYLLNSWFDIGFLNLERITWDSSASLLQKVILYEAVHKIKSWTDLENRLSEDRRFYAFFHPRLKGVPLIFVEIALMKKVADSVQEILNENRDFEDVSLANTAIFYSISNTQNGLRGISFGNFLIKRVVKELKKEFPNLKNFVTLSPIPRFNNWLKEQIKNNKLDDLITEKYGFKVLNPQNFEKIKATIKQLSSNPIGINDLESDYLMTKIKPILEKLSSIYLVNFENNWSNDPVLKFHLNNGAFIYRVNWMADTSDNGLKQSMGMMVNYWYSLKHVEKNHEEFNSNKKNYSKEIAKKNKEVIEI